MRRSFMAFLVVAMGFQADASAADNPIGFKLPPLGMPPSAPTDVISLGIRSARVNLLLGQPTLGSLISPLHRRTLTYADGTTIVFVSDCAVSAIPGGLAIGDAACGFTTEHNGKRIFIEPSLLCGNPAPEPFTGMKLAVEENAYFAPRDVEPLVPVRPSLPVGPRCNICQRKNCGSNCQ